MDIYERLHSKGVLNVATGCIEYSGYRSNGYGVIKLNGKSQKAHRVSYILEHGEIPEGMVVRHKCDNPACFNIAHLELGTQQDNIKDMHERGRSKRVISDMDIAEIQASKESSKTLADRYGVTTRRINQLR